MGVSSFDTPYLRELTRDVKENHTIIWHHIFEDFPIFSKSNSTKSMGYKHEPSYNCKRKV